MAEQDVESSGPFDLVVLDLQRLRVQAGSPSYAEIVLRVVRMRQERGLTPAEARVGRTTVYDAFRTGRRRIDVDLVLDIVRALDGDADVETWRRACRRAQEPATPAPAPRSSATRAEPALLTPRQDRLLGPVGVLALLVACVALNLMGRSLVDALQLPLYLDMVGTAIAAVVVGPWRGAAVGVSTNLLGALISGPASLPFALVNLTGALVWGYGVRRFAMGRSVPRFFVLNVLVAGACTLVAAPIIVLVFGGAAGHETDSITQTLTAITHHLWVSVFSSNLLSSLADKLISGFVALVAFETVAARSSARAVRPTHLSRLA